MSEEKEKILNRMKNNYKIALFMVIRNSQVMPNGIKLGKSEILDKVKEFVTKISTENAEKYNSIKQKEVDFSEWNLADGILNIIEGEK